MINKGSENQQLQSIKKLTQGKNGQKRIIKNIMRSFIQLTSNQEEIQLKELTTYDEKGLYVRIHIYKL